jgi:FtsH-binding integral membrane protein
MSHLDRNLGGLGGTMTPAETAAIDAGLRAYMARVYTYMLIGLAITGFAVLAVCRVSVTDSLAHAAYVVRAGRVIPVPPGLVVQSHDLLLTGIGHTVFVSPLKWAIIFAPLALVLGLSFGVGRLRPVFAQALFWLYAGMVGLSLGSLFLIYAHTSIARVFFIAAAGFGALSLWGSTTQRDLSGPGLFTVMVLVGVVIAGLVNLSLDGSALQWALSLIGVLVFSGLTAWDQRQLKNEYLYGAMDGATAERPAILGALSLYLDFVNLLVRPAGTGRPRVAES